MAKELKMYVSPGPNADKAIPKNSSDVFGHMVPGDVTDPKLVSGCGLGAPSDLLDYLDTASRKA